MTTAPIRDRFTAFVERHDVAWELAMAGLALVYVAIGFVNDQTESQSLDIAELVLTGVFALEFSARFLAARNRRQYLNSHWIDLISLAPPIRGLRVLRLLRLLRLVRTFSGVYRATAHMKAIAQHRGFAWLIVSWLAVMVLCSAGLYIAEHGVNKAIDSPLDALWWGVVTLSTIGYGDVYPITPIGRLIAMVLIFLGIGLFSAITATITSYLVGLGHAESRPNLPAELQALALLHDHGSLSDEEFGLAKSRLLAH